MPFWGDVPVPRHAFIAIFSDKYSKALEHSATIGIVKNVVFIGTHLYIYIVENLSRGGGLTCARNVGVVGPTYFPSSQKLV